MAGQGSLRQMTGCALQGLGSWALVLLALLCGPVATTFGQQQRPDVTPLRFRVAWSDPQPRYWQILVSLDEANDSSKIISVENHCQELASTGAYHVGDQRNKLLFAPRGASTGGEFELQIEASPQSNMTISIVGLNRYTKAVPENANLWQLKSSWSVQQLLDGQNQTLAPVRADDLSPIVCQIQRVPDDSIVVRGLAQPPHYDADQAIEFTTQLSALSAHPNSELQILFELREAFSGIVVDQNQLSTRTDDAGNSQPMQVSFPCPIRPGAYQLRCQVRQSPEKVLMVLSRKGDTLVSSDTPLLVLGEPEDPRSQEWNQVARISPANESDWEIAHWLPSASKKLLRRIDLLDSSPTQTSNYRGETVIELNSGKHFATSLPHHTPHLPHQVTLRYRPQNDTRLTVEIANQENFANPVRRFTLVNDETIANQDGWAEQTITHYPSGEEEYIRVINGQPTSSAGLESIAIFAGPGSLSAKAPVRSKPSREAILSLPSLTWVKALSSDLQQPRKEIGPKTQLAMQLITAVERLCDYAKAHGYTGIKIPAIDRGICWYPTQLFMPTQAPSHSTDRFALGTVLRACERKDLKLYVEISPTVHFPIVESQLIRGEQASNYFRRSTFRETPYDFRQPQVRQSLRALIKELDSSLRHSSAFGGLVLQCNGTNHFAPLTIQDLTPPLLEQLAKDVGRVDDTPGKIGVWANGPGRATTESWLARKSYLTYQELTNSLSHPTLLMVEQQTGGAAEQPVGSFLVQDFRHLCSDKITSVNRASLQVDERTHSVATAVAIGGRYEANAIENPSDVQLASAQLSDVAVSLNPSLVVIEDPSLAFVMNAKLRAKINDFTAMPSKTITRVPGSDAEERTVCVRYAWQENELRVSITNLAPWASEIRVDMDQAYPWNNIASHPDPSGTWRATDASILVELAPNSSLTLQADVDRPSTNRRPIRQWTSRILGGNKTASDIKQQITTVVQRMGLLSDPRIYDQLSNGGFEKVGGVGIVGWMQAQHPPGAVIVADGGAMQGNRSLLLTNNNLVAGRAWVVSENIPAPLSGRLAVSLACRGEPLANQPPHQLRVSIEGSRQGKPFRAQRIVEVARDGQWKERKMILEVEHLNPEQVESVRLTIDSLTKGRVWIDDVQLHDWFPTATERDTLQNDAFLAVKGMQQGNLTHAARLLHSYWAQHLIAKDAASMPTLPARDDGSSKPATGVAERIKGWIPQPLRF